MYERFDRIDGRHPWRLVSPEGYVDYPVRFRKGGRVLFFNFALARELGLIPPRHSLRMTPKLHEKILKAFSIQILNEHDWMNRRRYPRDGYEDRLYMATRYLQTQHKNRRGETSGDGRSIWNGYVISPRGMTYDISSRGTGNTILSPGAQLTKKPIPTGDNTYGYSTGLADLDEMLGGALMSEIFYQRGIPTERTLAVIGYKDKTSIGVRTAPNLLRPAHFFRYLKSGHHTELKRSFDYYLERQEKNRQCVLPARGKARYEKALEYICRSYAKFVALMEEEYIFNWLAWDGDNMLATGAVLDYGSVRQFAAKHSKYRYEDVDRFSASLIEQKREARYILQTFVQMIDFIVTGKKKNIRAFSKHKLLADFDAHYEEEGQRVMLYHIGFNKGQIAKLLSNHQPEVRQFRRALSYFEDIKSQKGPIKLADGVDHPPVFLVRNILRELPSFLLAHKSLKAWPILPPEEFCRIMRKSYVKKADLTLTPLRRKRAFDFQRYYMDLIYAVGRNRRWATLKRVAARSAVINHAHRGTGDGLIWVVEEAIKIHSELDQDKFQGILDRFIKAQVLVPGKFKPLTDRETKGRDRRSRALRQMRSFLEEFNETI